MEILSGVTQKFHSVECVEFSLEFPIVYSEKVRQCEAIISEFDIFDHFHSKSAHFRPEQPEGKRIKRDYSEAQVINGKVICAEPKCNHTCLKKNLNRHYESAHKGLKVDWVKYSSAQLDNSLH